LSSAKEALHDDDISGMQIPSSLDKFGGYKMLSDIEPEPPEQPAVLQPEDPVIPNYDQNEETSLEYIEAKVNLTLYSQCTVLTYISVVPSI